MGVNYFQLIFLVCLIPLIFNFFLNNPASRNPDDVEGIQKVVAMWTQFAKTGRPHPEWKSMKDPSKFDYFLIRKTAKMQQNPFKERMDFWNNFKEEYPLNKFTAYTKA